MTLLVAGHETTALALTWALYWIHLLPEVRNKLMKQLDTLGRSLEDPSAIARLPYLNAVCHSTLRIYPVLKSVNTLVHRHEVVGWDRGDRSPQKRS